MPKKYGTAKIIKEGVRGLYQMSKKKKKATKKKAKSMYAGALGANMLRKEYKYGTVKKPGTK